MTKKLIIGVFSLLLFASCGKAAHNGKIDRDCTGTYLELNNEDYLICNPSMTDSYPDGSEVTVHFNVKQEGKMYGTCYMHHEHIGYVEITSISQ